jgi:hypothetical protein
MMLGRVDEVDGSYVATKFLAFLVPQQCVYVAGHGSPRATLGASSMLRLRTDWRSIGHAYARVWLPILAIAFPIPFYFFGGVPLGVWMSAGAMLAIAVTAHHSGGLSEAEKERLRLLGTITGLRIDPSRLRADTRERKRDVLAALMEKGGIPKTTEGILQVLEDIPLPAMPLVYGYARYVSDDTDWHECAEAVYDRHVRGDI